MLNKFLSMKNSVMWVIAVGLIIIPLSIKSPYFQDIIVLTFLWAGLASSWNLYSGYCKRLSIGHAAFFGIGAYTSTLLFMKFNISPWIGMFAGVILAVIFALIIGGSTLRLKGTFFVLATISFSELLRIFAHTSKDITNGPMGLLVPFSPGFMNMAFTSKIPYAIIMWVYMLVVIYACVRFEKSRLGYYLIAIGENQEAAESLGVNSTKTMLIVFVLSAAFTSIGGTLFAQYIAFIEPDTVIGLGNSTEFILISIIGGMGTAFGPFVGALMLTPLSNLLRGYLSHVSGLHGLTYGLVLVLILLFKPDGVFPQLRALAKRTYSKFIKTR